MLNEFFGFTKKQTVTLILMTWLAMGITGYLVFSVFAPEIQKCYGVAEGGK
jgi:hypothetical protein